MDKDQQSRIFRISAVLYANNNYQIAPLQSHRKVIEDALYLMNRDEGVTLDTLANYIEEVYYIGFTDDELKKVLHNEKFKDIFAIKPYPEKTLYLLKKERRAILDGRKPKVLDDFIREFVTEKGLSKDASESIYRYLYSLFTTNVDSFRRMLEALDVKTLLSTDSEEIGDGEVINSFLSWENPEKNKAVFDLASYALEYCMMTNKQEKVVQPDSLLKKTFYLDTNILYRVMGINGEERKKRGLYLLRKLLDTECTLKISKVTIEEYEGSLKTYIKKLRNSETPAVNSKVFKEYITYDDIYRSYHQWAAGRASASIDLFAAMLEASLKAFIEEYRVETDNLIPFNIKKEQDNLNQLTSQIKGMSSTKWYDTAMADARNVVWVERLRKEGEKSIFSTKTFLLSSDWGLFYWDSHYHSQDTPIVILPSQWLSLLLRYVSRTADDFKGFVSFLNIQTKEGPLNSEQTTAILAGIAEMTDDINEQKYLLETIIETEFKDGAKGQTNDQLKMIAKRDAERLLQEKMDKMTAMTEELKASLADMGRQMMQQAEEHKKLLEEKNEQNAQLAKTIDLLREDIKALKAAEDALKQQKEDERKNFTETIKGLKSQLEEERNKSEFKAKRRKRIFWKSIVIIALVILIVWYFTTDTTANNWMGNFLRWIDTLDDNRKSTVRAILPFLVSLILIPMVIWMGKDVFTKYKKEK